MLKKKVSISNIYRGIGISFFILGVCFITAVFFYFQHWIIRASAFLFITSFVILAFIFILLVRKKIVDFSDSISQCIEDIMNGKEEIAFHMESEDLIAKIHVKLRRLYKIMRENSSRNENEKQAIQEMVSDISHQVKTPVANLKMYNSTLLQSQLPAEKQREFLLTMEIQINKLDFLMQSLVKMSRLEIGAITLYIESIPLYDTLALALSSIVLPAEKKNIEVTINCDPHIKVFHDRKWTAEALFNILDNAVKYTEKGGKISVEVTRWEMYTKIDISDTGKGIAKQNVTNIFKRFYREEEVQHIYGVGIGLYLSRQIISPQGGYIKVTSKVGMGSTFSVFLPNERQF
ncbi:sensor histidine kinase [Clostridium kluyveri]|uniref:histidine kinase n=1 Tax=Clostridium kluyveri TaxID=1534 RepID=A0A1L5FCC5_CLOKL|nr:HAMP domain-containing sensor histidine kinase [Clostridium kluyveri]APM40662.1 two-component sensor histidine kinase [Clostridium kluyveri]